MINTAQTVSPTPTQSATHSETDLALNNSAFQLNDPGVCDQISDVNFGKECKTNLQNQQNESEALTKKDTTLCSKLSTPDLQKACQIKVETQLKLEEQSKQKTETINSYYLKSDEIVASGDYTRCKEISDPNIQLACESNILDSKAMETGDKTWCAKHSTAEAKAKCENSADNVPQAPKE